MSMIYKHNEQSLVIGNDDIDGVVEFVADTTLIGVA